MAHTKVGTIIKIAQDYIWEMTWLFYLNQDYHNIVKGIFKMQVQYCF